MLVRFFISIVIMKCSKTLILEKEDIMQITAIYHQGVPVHPQFQEILHMITNTLQELEINLELIDLATQNLPYYAGKKTGKMDEIIDKIQRSEAVLLGMCTTQGSIGGPMEVLLDHCTDSAYQLVFQNKLLLSLVLSKDWGEKEAANYLQRRWENLQGIQGEQMIGNLPQMTTWNPAWTTTIERKTEDFYRVLRQKRIHLPTSGAGQPTKVTIGKYTGLPISSSINQSVEHQTRMPQQPTGLSTGIPKNTLFQEKLSQATINFESFNQQQQEDIEEITMLLKKQLNPVPKPATVTAKQMTMSLPHYFQPHLVGDSQVCIQLQIEGIEPFQASLQIDKNHCHIEEGNKEEADLTLHVEEEVWKEVLRGKLSFQRAFMTGQMKVKGNFIYLNKLEQWFAKIDM